MSKYIGPDCRLCRREGAKLFRKGDKCYTDKCPVVRRPAAPGDHGTGKKKMSDYAMQLREKQKAKRIYGIYEKQFRSYYEKAEKMRGVTGENMLILIERRLDNVIYRMGIAVSRSQARQLVTHGMFTLNGDNVTIPSLLVNVGDVIAVKENKKELELFKALKESPKKNLPKWLEFDNAVLTGKIKAIPERADIDAVIAEHMIVELYSK
ncbi:MAG: 30S ribosomal protein S4 [Christensenellales bacterium]|jgi:small subunit ribosomal protein S4